MLFKRIYIAVVLVLIGLNLSAQTIYYGTGSQIATSMTIDAIDDAFNKLGKLTHEKSQQEANLLQLRNGYWKQYEKSKMVDPTTEENYAKALFEKDMYYAAGAVFDKLFSPRASGANSYGKFEAADLISGGKFDGGIHPYAQEEFDIWVNAIIRKWNKEKTSTFDLVFLGGLIYRNSIEYQQYTIARNKSEYWFNYQNSPLKQEGYAYLRGYLFYTEIVASEQEYQSEKAEILKYTNEANLLKGISKLKNIMSTQLIKKKKSKADEKRDLLFELYYQVSLNDPEFYPLVMLEKHYRLGYPLCSRINNNRISLYGAESHSRAVNESIKDKCYVNGQECLSRYLEANLTVYKDLHFLAGLNKNSIQTENEVRSFLKRKVDPAISSSPYRDIIQFYSKEELHRAYYLFEQYSENLFPNIKGEISPEFRLIQVLEGFAWMNKDLDGYASLVLAYKYDSKNAFNNWLNGINELKKYEREGKMVQIKQFVGEKIASVEMLSPLIDYSKPTSLLKKFREMDQMNTAVTGTPKFSNEYKSASLINAEVLKQSIQSFDVNTTYTKIFDGTDCRVFFWGILQSAQNVMLYIELDQDENLQDFKERLEQLIIPLIYQEIPDLYYIHFSVFINNCQAKRTFECYIKKGTETKYEFRDIDFTLSGFSDYGFEAVSSYLPKELLRKTKGEIGMYEVPMYYSLERPLNWSDKMRGKIMIEDNGNVYFDSFYKHGGYEGNSLEKAVDQIIAAMGNGSKRFTTENGIKYAYINAMRGSNHYLAKFGENGRGVYFIVVPSVYSNVKKEVEEVLESLQYSPYSLGCK